MNRNVLRKPATIPCLILILCAALAAAEDKKDAPPAVTSTSAFKLTGYTQARAVADHFGPDTFHLYRARFGLEGEVFKNIRFKALFETARTPLLLDAMIDYSPFKNGFIRIGQFKIPFSQENLSSAALMDTINFSQVVGKLVPGRDISANGRDIGALADYKYGTWEGMVGVFNGSGINKADTDENKDIAARLTWSPWEFLTVGASQYLGHTIPANAAGPAGKRNRTGLEMAFSHSGFMLKGEYVYGIDNAKEASGWYLTGGCFVMPKKLQAVVRVDVFDKDLSLGQDRNSILLLGLNWFFSTKTKIQLNCELAQLEGRGLDFSALLAQFQVGF
jgi:hypothetical protein